MLTKIVILTVMLIIFIALGSGLYFLIYDTEKTNRTVKALTVRITISIVLFLFLLFGFATGWLSPNT